MPNKVFNKICYVPFAVYYCLERRFGSCCVRCRCRYYHTGLARLCLPIARCGWFDMWWSCWVFVVLWCFEILAADFLILSTSILYLISAGLFSRGAWYFENYRFNLASGGDASEGGDGNGSYNIRRPFTMSIVATQNWTMGGYLQRFAWMAEHRLLVIHACYNIYWLVLIIVLSLMIFEERRGHLPFTKNLQLKHLNPGYWIKNKKKQELTEEQKRQLFAKMENINFNEDGEINVQENYELPEQTTSHSSSQNVATDKEVLHVKADSL
ncbi:Iron permease FTR1 family protein [Saccharomyces cerevisiae]|nr:Iron permease FTR1 family protein [Saccharomyces cerevisiae]